MTAAELRMLVPLFDCKLTKDKKKYKLNFAFSGELKPLEDCLAMYISKLRSAELRQGRAPRGDLERKIQSRLDKLR